MMDTTSDDQRVLAVFGPAALPTRDDDPAQAGVLQITLSHDNELMIRGPRVAVTAFLADCARRGLVIELAALNWCG